MLDENILPISENEKVSENINFEIFKYFKENYTSTIDIKDVDTIVANILECLDCEVEKSEIEKLVTDWMEIAISLRGKDIVVVEDNMRDFSDIQAAINELGLNVRKKRQRYNSINEVIIDSEINDIKNSESNLNVVITDILDNSDELEYIPKIPLRSLQYLPNPTEDEKAMIGNWINIAKNNLIIIADVAKKLEKHMIVVTKISRKILGEIINNIYDQGNIKNMFENKDSDSVASRVHNAGGEPILYQTKNVTLISKPYYDDDDNVSEIIKEYNAAISKFKDALKDKLLDILIK